MKDFLLLKKDDFEVDNDGNAKVLEKKENKNAVVEVGGSTTSNR